MTQDIDFLIETERLKLRRWRDDEIDRIHFYNLWSNLDVTNFLLSNGPMSQEECEEKFLKELNVEKKFGVQFWPVFTNEGNKFVGTCGLNPYKLFDGIFEFKIQLLPSYWNQSYGYEIGKHCLEYAYYILNIKDLFSSHCPQNSAAATLLKKLGFRFSHFEYNVAFEQNQQSYILNLETHHLL